MGDLAEFLLARITEDEAAARAASGEWGNGLPATIHPDPTVYRTVTRGVGYVCGSILAADAEHIARHDPTRVLAECEAKRQMVEALDDLVREHENTLCNDEDAEGRYVQRAHFYRQEMLRLLALPYADHPDYRQEWRP